MTFKLKEETKNTLVRAIEKNLFKTNPAKWLVIPIMLDTKYGKFPIELKVENPRPTIAVPTGPVGDKFSSYEIVELTEEDLV